MKLKNILLEVGDASPYDFDREYKNADIYGRGENEDFRGLRADYEFETESGTRYKIRFRSFSNTSRHDNLEDPRRVIKVDFESMDHSSYWGYPEPLTNEHDFYRIFSTVVKAAKDLYSEYGEYIDGFVFSGGLKDKDRQSIESQRAQLYKYFIEQKFPNAEIDTVYQGGKDYFYVEL